MNNISSGSNKTEVKKIDTIAPKIDKIAGKSMAARGPRYFDILDLIKKPVKSAKPKLNQNPVKPKASSSTNTNNSEPKIDYIQMKPGIDRQLPSNMNKTTDCLLQNCFEQNEFGMSEMNTLGMIKYKSLFGEKLPQNIETDFQQLSMACNHFDATECFDEIVIRFFNDGSTSEMLDRTPHQLFSTEFQKIVGTLIKNNNNNCSGISKNDIRQAFDAHRIQPGSSKIHRCINNKKTAFVKKIDKVIEVPVIY